MTTAEFDSSKIMRVAWGSKNLSNIHCGPWKTHRNCFCSMFSIKLLVMFSRSFKLLKYRFKFCNLQRYTICSTWSRKYLYRFVTKLFTITDATFYNNWLEYSKYIITRLFSRSLIFFSANICWYFSSIFAVFSDKFYFHILTFGWQQNALVKAAVTTVTVVVDFDLTPVRLLFDVEWQSRRITNAYKNFLHFKNITILAFEEVIMELVKRKCISVLLCGLEC